MAPDRRDDSTGPSGLPEEIVGRIGRTLSNGNKVVTCVATAARLLVFADVHGDGLRFAESAAYNLREALDAVVAGSSAAAGGWEGALAAWRRFELARSDGDLGDALGTLTADFERLAAASDRQALMTRRLLGFLHERSGIPPIQGANDPSVAYRKLRARANTMLHDRASDGEVTLLHGDVVAWLVRMFTPPDDRVVRLTELASSPFGAARLSELRQLTLDAHHVRLFLSLLQDPAWLEPLRAEGFVHCPRPNELWPVGVLADSGTLSPGDVADLLESLFDEVRALPKADRAVPSGEIMRVACRLGPAGHQMAIRILAAYPTDRWVSGLAVSVARDADPTDDVQVGIADSVLGTENRVDGGYRTRTILELLLNGMTLGNAAERVKLVAAKVLHLSRRKEFQFLSLDVASLDTPGNDLREPIELMSHTLTQMIQSARGLGVTTDQIFNALSGIRGELGERLLSRVLAGAQDVDRLAKVNHIATRLAASRATGDDKVLIDDILSAPLSDTEVESWRTALGTPPDPGAVRNQTPLSVEWLRSWRWSTLLPASVLEGWEPAIEACNEAHGTISLTLFETRVDRFAFASGSSPYDENELLGLGPEEAAIKVANWRPGPEDAWGVSARELARSLERAVKAAPREWAERAPEVVTWLREPVYVDHFLRALAAEAIQIRDMSPMVMESIRIVRTERWTPTMLGDDDGYDFESDWSGVDQASIDVVWALANADGNIEDDLDFCWTIASSLFADRPQSSDSVAGVEIDPDELNDPLNTAINRSYGHALEAALALAGWTYRSNSTTDRRITQILDEALALPDDVGLQLRAIVASRRPFIEAVAANWVDTRAGILFTEPPLGAPTIDLTLKWARPTTWFLDRYRTQLFGRARATATQRATIYLVHGMLWSRPGYGASDLLDGLHGNVAALARLGATMALLVQTAEADDPALEQGLALWERLVDAEPTAVPAEALVGLGRWAFVTAVDDDRWIDLMDRTLARTQGRTDLLIEVAERCNDAQPSVPGLRMLRRMLLHGEPWESQVVAETGLKALRSAAPAGATEEFTALREALIERGLTEAAQIKPDGDESSAR